MAQVKFTGELKKEGNEFVVKIELRFPTQDQASDVGQWLHNTIKDHFEAKGGTLKSENSPLILQ